MPTFTVDVKPQEFLNSCSSHEKEKLTRLLEIEVTDEPVTYRSYDEEQFEIALVSLHGKWNMLTLAEEEAIKVIAKKFR